MTDQLHIYPPPPLHTHNLFMAHFPGLAGWAGARRNSGLYDAREDNRGRHTNHPDGCHSIRTSPSRLISNPSPSSRHFYARWPSYHNAPNSWVAWLI